MNKIRNVENVTLYEVICNETLERPLHPSEKVIETALRWSIWVNEDERKSNYLILKKNTLYPSLVHYVSLLRHAHWTINNTDNSRQRTKCVRFKMHALHPHAIFLMHTFLLDQKLINHSLESSFWGKNYLHEIIPGNIYALFWLLSKVKRRHYIDSYAFSSLFTQRLCTHVQSVFTTWFRRITHPSVTFLRGWSKVWRVKETEKMPGRMLPLPINVIVISFCTYITARF